MKLRTRIVLLALLGQVVNGMSGWINYNGLGIQPSEFAKIVSIVFLACYYDKNKNNLDNIFFSFDIGRCDN